MSPAKSDRLLARLLVLQLFFLSPLPAWASAAEDGRLDLTAHWVGFTALVLFGLAYALVMAEEFTHLRKSKPVILAAGLIWALIAIVYADHGMNHVAEGAVRHNLLEYAELMLFLLVAMTYINAMSERNVFGALRSWLIKKGYGLRKLFWITGALAFFISPVADNLTTALLMCAVVMAVGGENTKFVLVACISIVVAANAGGTFSPFGDITTLMVWQKEIETPQGVVGFGAFFALFVPALVNWLLPAAIMSITVPNTQPHAGGEAVVMKRGARRIIALFLLTIVTAVSPNPAIEILADLMPGLWHTLERLDGRSRPRQSMLKVRRALKVRVAGSQWHGDGNSGRADARASRRGELLLACRESGRWLWRACHGLCEAAGTNAVK